MRLKVAVVSAYPRTADTIVGGVEGVAQCLATAVRDIDDVEMHVVAPCVNRKPGIELRNGVLIHWLANTRLPGFLGYWTTYRWAIHRCLRRIQPDIAHFQGVAGWMLGYKGACVLTVHGIPELDVLYVDRYLKSTRHKTVAIVERVARKRAKNIIANSPYVLHALDGQIAGRVWQIENPVDSDLFKVRRKCVAGRILFVGRVSRLKNVLGLIRAFALVHQRLQTATLHIAGDPESPKYQSQCLREVATQGVSKSVTFLGSIDRRTLLQELGQAECVVLVSLQENAPLIVSEAMAAGVPVIASNRCGIPYMIEDGQTGLLVDPLDPNDIAEKLLTVMMNPQMSAAMSHRSRVVATERFHAKSVAVRTREVYRHVLGK